MKNVNWSMCLSVTYCMNEINKQRGFRVMALIGFVGFIGLFLETCPNIEREDSVTRRQLSTFKTCLSTFRLDTGCYPDTAAGLESLFRDTGQYENWEGPYLENETDLINPWGEPYLYETPDIGCAKSFKLKCLGADGKRGGRGANQDNMITG